MRANPSSGLRRPLPVWHANYLHRNQLEERLFAVLSRLCVRKPAILLEIGCGQRHYAPFLCGVAERYVAVDCDQDSAADVFCNGQQLPFRDSSIDTVLSIQTLEHVIEPKQLLIEAARVLKPGGVLIASTHGTFFYHPSPGDYWRWTQAGLRTLANDVDGLSVVELLPVGGSFSAIAFLNGWYAAALLSALHRRVGPFGPIVALLRSAVSATFNTIGWMLDAALPQFARLDEGGTTFLSFVLVAEKTLTAKT